MKPLEDPATAGQFTSPLDLVRLTQLMALTCGSPEVGLCLIDGPLPPAHADFSESLIREVPGGNGTACHNPASYACVHGAFTAGILVARRGSNAPAICPSCTLMVRPIFNESSGGEMRQPNTNPRELAAAILDCINVKPKVINLSLSVVRAATGDDSDLKVALDQAMIRGVIVVAAAGNQGIVGSSVITRHPWVIPVAACNREGLPVSYSNYGMSIGARGLRAPGEGVTSTGARGSPISSSGTSVAAPFVTGTIALLWSMFPSAAAQDVKLAVTRTVVRRDTVVPPLLDAWTAYQALAVRHKGVN